MTRVYNIMSGELSQNITALGPVKSVIIGVCALELAYSTNTDMYFLSNENDSHE
jgi:hypothetical protein